MKRFTRHLVALGGAVALSVTAFGSVAAPDAPAAPAAPDAALPTITPTPQQATALDGQLPVTSRTEIVTDAGTDPQALAALKKVLADHGVTRVDEVAPGAEKAAGVLRVRLGADDRADIAAGLKDTVAGDRAEAYALRASKQRNDKTVVLGGHDGAGQFYAVQTFRQLFTGAPGRWQVAAASVSDHPAMPLRGSIEGFYGDPWTPDERLDQMDFYGHIKANTYIYAPKDDPYHRDKWRDAYPADKLDELGTLVDRATANKVRFTFAVSPGGSICYSDQADRDALKAKLQAVYDLGVRSFSVPLDDISYTKWNCAGDEAEYGAPGRQAAAKAQVSLLNDLQQNWVDSHEGTQPLQMVPTEYGDVTDTAYKQEMRATLDPKVVVMWTGTDVVPPTVTNADADKISQLFGRQVFLWDNYPVNDFGNTAGRLLLAPYDKREAGLSEHLSGIVANPMNQPYASKVAVFGTADFAWNDRAYDADRNLHQAMSYLAGGDAEATRALLVFGDLEHMAPTFGATPWQPQAPVLDAKVKEFWATVDAGDTRGAIAALRAYAVQIQQAPGIIRGDAVQPGFATDAKSWLDATELWGGAMVAQLDAMTAQLDGDSATSKELSARAKKLIEQAKAIKVDPPRNSWGSVTPKIGDGVLDVFLARVSDMVDEPITVTAPAKAVFGADGVTEVPVTVQNRFAGDVTGVSVTISAEGAAAEPAVLDLGDLAQGEKKQATVRLKGEGAPAATALEVKSAVTWTGAQGPGSADISTPVQSTCSAEPVRPVAATADSQETAQEDTPAAKAIDGDPKTFWGTEWSGAEPTPPHHLVLDLGQARDVCAVRYLPRQDSTNGQIAGYQVFTSADGTNWGDPVAGGELPGGTAEKWIPFAQSNARYVKLVATSEIQDRPWTTAAEVSVDAR